MSIYTIYKIPKGCFDISDIDADNFTYLKNIIEDEFIKNGGKYIETPVFERKDVLLQKYGETAEEKKIYSIEEIGSEEKEHLALRFDLTIPFIRYIKTNKVEKMRRYAIGKVYRRDLPNKKNGRLCEFYQADFDILGENNKSMMAEATLLKMVDIVMKKLNIDYTIYINDINNLKTLLIDKIGIDESKWKDICPTIDKLDKQSFDSLKSEFKEKHLSDEMILELNKEIDLKEPINDSTKINWIKLCDIATVWGFRDKLVFTNSLARGLDYYSGFVWEVKLKGSGVNVVNPNPSIIAGGRYDTLLNTSLVGISFGLSRMLQLCNEQISLLNNIIWQDVYFVATLGSIDLIKKLEIIEKLRSESKSVLYSFDTDEKRKLVKIINDCIMNKIRWLVIIGENELKEGRYIVKDLMNKTQVLDFFTNHKLNNYMQ